MEQSRTLITMAQSVAAIIEAGGEISPELEALVTVDLDNMPSKIEGYAQILERLQVEKPFWAEKAKKIAAVAKACGVLEEKLKDNLKFAMQTMNTTELIGIDTRFKLSNTKPSLVIEDQAAIPKEYFVQVTETVLEKDRLLEDLKIGEIPGAKLVPSYSLRSYVNKGVK